jgi:hypothetical protein
LLVLVFIPVIDYQAMLNDTDNIYFYRVKSRDAAGRLTGHIVGNGLSTEQEYSPASQDIVVLILVIFLLELYKT